MRSTCRRLLACCLVLVAARLASADNWPQWRGPTYNGICTETVVPTQWGEGKNIAWAFPLPGLGGSTPAIWGDRLFLTSEDGKDSVLICLGTDGKERWKRKVGRALGKSRGDEGDGASASPSTDGKHVFVFVESGEIACFDFDGNEVWKFDAQQRYGKFKIAFGLHSTPVLYNGRLYQQFIHDGGAWVVAIGTATGKDIWKVARPSDGRGENQQSYASATLWRNGKDACLIVHGNNYATGHSLEDGHELWRVAGLNTKNRGDLRFVASPAASPDLIVIPSAKDHGVVGLKPSASGRVEAGSPHEFWRLTNHTPDVPSPLIYDGLVYLSGESGMLTCLDAKTGKQYYRERIHGAPYRASPVYAAGNIYLTARDGTVTVARAGKTLEVVGENKLSDVFVASPAISDGRLYLRGRRKLYAIGGKEK